MHVFSAPKIHRHFYFPVAAAYVANTNRETINFGDTITAKLCVLLV